MLVKNEPLVRPRMPETLADRLTLEPRALQDAMKRLYIATHEHCTVEEYGEFCEQLEAYLTGR